MLPLWTSPPPLAGPQRKLNTGSSPAALAKLVVMPELPEVETVARGLSRGIRGDAIASVWIGSKPEPLKSPASEIASTLEGAGILGARRVGKHVVIDLDIALKKRGSRPTRATAQFVVHLGMTGRLLIASAGAEIAPHTHLIARLESGRELRFVDPRRFGRLSVATDEFQAVGAEPLDVGFELFAGLFRKRNTPIKSALLNQKLLSGIGNIYADESLFRAGIRPLRRAGSLTLAQLRRLYDSVQEVLKQAIAAGGSSVSDYVDASGNRGFFQFEHRVYGHEGDPCTACATPIKRIVIAGRSAHYCPKCQK